MRHGDALAFATLRTLAQTKIPHGMLIVDDYGWFRALGDRRILPRPSSKPMPHRVDQRPRMIIKPI